MASSECIATTAVPTENIPAGHSAVSEGSAVITSPGEANVFYNPIQQFNRDVSILAIKSWSALYGGNRKRKRDQKVKPGFTILEALAATGLRSIRYAKEVPGIRKVIANDLSPSAFESIEQNIKLNNVDHIVQPHLGNARTFLVAPPERIDVIDLDPYGTAAPFIDGAVNCVSDNGLLCITCTDLAVLAGNSYPEKCFSLYGGTTVRSDALHESALRLVLGLVSSTAARYGRSIEPLLSLSIDYYVRVFVKVKVSPSSVKTHLGCMSTVRCCSVCQNTSMQPLGRVESSEQNIKFKYAQAYDEGTHCRFCGSTVHIAGPLYSGPLHNNEFVDNMLASLSNSTLLGTTARIKGMLSLARHELEVPFYVNPSRLLSKVGSPIPPLSVFCSALLNAGYRVSLTHAQPGCVKTDASSEFLWDLARAWALQNGVSEGRSSACSSILKREPSSDVSFELHPDFEKLDSLRKAKMVRFHQAPKNWGPQARPSKRSRV